MTGRPLLLGMDPGFAAFGWCLLELGTTASRDEVLDAGVLHTKKSSKKRDIRATDDNLRRVRELTQELVRLCGDRVRVLAAESFQHGKHKHTAVKVALAWGAVGSFAELRSMPLLQSSPQETKVAACGVASASKTDVEEAMRRRYTLLKLSPKKTDAEHVFDAIAAAHACLETDVVRMLRGSR